MLASRLNIHDLKYDSLMGFLVHKSPYSERGIKAVVLSMIFPGLWAKFLLKSK